MLRRCRRCWPHCSVHARSDISPRRGIRIKEHDMMRQIAGSFAEYEKRRLVRKLREARERSGKLGGRKSYSEAMPETVAGQTARRRFVLPKDRSRVGRSRSLNGWRQTSRRFAKAAGYDVVDWFNDPAVSGADPARCRCRSQCRGPIDATFPLRPRWRPVLQASGDDLTDATDPSRIGRIRATSSATNTGPDKDSEKRQRAAIERKPVLVSPRCSIVSRTMASVSCLSRMRAACTRFR